MSVLPPSVAPFILQGSATGPVPTGLHRVTSPIMVPQSTDFRLRSFPDTVYNLSPQSHIVKLMRVLLGDAGAGQFRKRLMMSRLSESLTSAYFFDLDAFWGAIFGLSRTPDELLTINPYSDTATQDVWRDQQGRDQSYRDRIFQFGRAVGFGPSPTGMELIAEAILNVPCDIYESYLYADLIARTYHDLESFTYTQLEAFTYQELEGTPGTPANSVDRLVFIVRPHRKITIAEEYALHKVISKIKPANTIMIVDSTGLDVFQDIPLRGAWASSSYWEINQQVSGASISKPAFSSYQGESWVYNHDINGVLAYQLDVHGNNLTSQNYQRLVWADGTYTDFLPTQATTTTWENLLGRYAADGVAASNPLAGRPVLNGSSSVADIVIDGASLDEVAALVKQPVNSLARRTNETLRFWSTPARAIDDQTSDVLEVRFDGYHTVSTIAFDVAHFPQFVSVQSYDDRNGQWVEIYTETVSDSIPALLPNNENYLIDRTHPQHSGDGHWHRVVAKVNALKTNRIRVVLGRSVGNGPQIEYVTPTHNGLSSVRHVPVPYSLAVRRMNIGYIVDGALALPVRNTGNDVIGSASDLNGNSVSFSAYQETPSGPIQFSEPLQWRCEPQPVPNAVVNYFVDTRDKDGDPQVVDRFFVDPTHLGVHCTLYWSVDTAPIDGGWIASDDLMPVGIVTYKGTLVSSDYGLEFSSNDPSWMDIDNNHLQWSPGKSWWMGASFRDTLGSGTDHPILDLGNVGACRIFFQDNVLYLQPSNGDAVVQLPVVVPPNAVCSVIFGWLSTGNVDFPGGAQWILQAKVGNGSTISATGPSSNLPVQQPPTIRIGASFTPTGYAIPSTPTYFEGFEAGNGGAICQNSSTGLTTGVQPTQSTDFAHTGTHSLKNVVSAASGGADGFLVALGNVGIGGATYISGGFAVTGGDAFQADVWFYCADSLQIMYGVIVWYDSSNNPISPSAIGSIGATATGTWIEMTGNVNAPLGATHGVFIFEVIPYFPITPDPTVVYFDDLSLIPMTVVRTPIASDDFETGIGLWNSFRSSDNVPNVTQPVRTTEQAHTGTHSLKCFDDTSHDGIFARNADVQLTGHTRNSGGFPCVAGEPYELDGWVYFKSPLIGTGTGIESAIDVSWFDSSNTLIGQVQIVNNAPASLDTWTHLVGQGIAPVGAVWGVVDIPLGSTVWDSGYPAYGDVQVSYVDDFVINHITYIPGGGGSPAPPLPPISGMILNALVLKSETLILDTIEGFMANPSFYTTKGSFHSQDQHGTDNAYLRLDPSFISHDNPGGLVGGPPYFCDGLKWTPIPRDYLMTKGYIHFDPTLASFWKFEMTNLAAEPYEGYLPIAKTVKVFPNRTALASTPVPSPLGYGGAQHQGVVTMGNLGSGQTFDNTGVAVSEALATSPEASDFMPTEALVAHDPSAASSLADRSWIYNMTAPDQGFSAPRFTQPGIHNYSEATVAHTGKIGYFCGFKEIKALRLQFTADDDTSLYDEAFYDGMHIDSWGTWTQNPGDLFITALGSSDV